MQRVNRAPGRHLCYSVTMLMLNIVGAGKLGRMLGRLWTQHRVFAPQDVLTAHAASAAAAVEFIGAGHAAESLTAMRSAPVWMLAPPDSRIVECSEALAASGRLRVGDIVFHCSGAQAASDLAAAARSGAHVASVHPLKSIADQAHAAQTFAGAWCGMEGDAEAIAVLKPAFAAIGARLFDIDPASKTIYHAASVLVCNYLTALIETGARCYEKAGVDRRTALEAMEPLVKETVDNVFRLGTTAALTGPIARGDHAVVARQLEALARWEPRVASIYRALGVAALELTRARGKADTDALAAIERTLSNN